MPPAGFEPATLGLEVCVGCVAECRRVGGSAPTLGISLDARGASVVEWRGACSHSCSHPGEGARASMRAGLARRRAVRWPAETGRDELVRGVACREGQPRTDLREESEHSPGDDRRGSRRRARRAAHGYPIGVDYYLTELARRDADRQTRTMVRQTGTMVFLTWVIAALTVVNVVAVVYSIAS